MRTGVFDKRIPVFSPGRRILMLFIGADMLYNENGYSYQCSRRKRYNEIRFYINH